MSPLTARVDGELLRASSFTDSDWGAVHVPARRRRVTILCPGCDFPMHPKQLGRLRYYAHNPGEGRPGCEHEGESLQHISLKSDLVAAALSAGARVETECSFDGGRVDVLADMGERAWALEAQISPLNLTDAIERDRLYRSAFGNSTWLHTGTRPWQRYVPALEVDSTDGSSYSVVGGVLEDIAGEVARRAHPLIEAVGHVLRRRYVWISGGRSDGAGSFGWYSDTARVRDLSGAQSAASRKARRRPDASGQRASDVCTRTGADLRELEVGQPSGPPAPADRGPDELELPRPGATSPIAERDAGEDREVPGPSSSAAEMTARIRERGAERQRRYLERVGRIEEPPLSVTATAGPTRGEASADPAACVEWARRHKARQERFVAGVDAAP